MLSTIDGYGLGISGFIDSALGIANTASTILSRQKQNEIAEQNFQLAKEQYEYQKQLQQQIFEREDNAFQRQLSDIQSAGLNPGMMYSSMGSGASSGAVVQTQTPQREYTPLESPFQQGALNAYLNYLSINSQINTAQANQALANSTAMENTAKAVAQQMENEKFAERYDLNVKKVEQELRIQALVEENQRLKNIDQANKNVEGDVTAETIKQLGYVPKTKLGKFFFEQTGTDIAAMKRIEEEAARKAAQKAEKAKQKAEKEAKRKAEQAEKAKQKAENIKKKAPSFRDKTYSKKLGIE